jgi:hypothetical protein
MLGFLKKCAESRKAAKYVFAAGNIPNRLTHNIRITVSNVIKLATSY